MEKVHTQVAEISTDVTDRARVILYNDEWHTFDEVIGQLMKAVRCSYPEAEHMAWTVHTLGKCKVFEGPLEACLHVSAVLEEIQLITSVEFD